jgi:hypothetical protein
MQALLAIALLWVTPSVDRIEYAHPEKYVALLPSLGSAATIQKTASEIHGTTDEDKLRAIGMWMRARFKFDEHEPNVWRDFDERLKVGVLASCADNALFFGTLARALGIPTVWVKTMDVDWIREYVRDPLHPASWRGHVFLEVFADKRWQLVDASEMVIYRDYDPRNRLLPGNRYAYDKGGDPAALTLSLHGQPWRDQTAAYLKTFDVRVLPVTGGHPLIRSLYIVADTPIWQWVQKRAEGFGVKTKASFNHRFDEWLPAASGNWLILTAVSSHFPLPSEYRDRYSPLSTLQLEDALRARASGRADRELADGTKVILLYARDEAALQREVDQLRF